MVIIGACVWDLRSLALLRRSPTLADNRSYLFSSLFSLSLALLLALSLLLAFVARLCCSSCVSSSCPVLVLCFVCSPRTCTVLLVCFAACSSCKTTCRSLLFIVCSLSSCACRVLLVLSFSLVLSLYLSLCVWAERSRLALCSLLPSRAKSGCASTTQVTSCTARLIDPTSA